MDKQIFHGDLTPADLASALEATFNRNNLSAKTIGSGDKMAVQITSHPHARSGGDTALTIHIRKVTEGVLVQMGDQATIGIVASLGKSAWAAFRNPLNLLHRLDDIAQDIENLQLDDEVWEVITKAAQRVGASHELSEKLKRLACAYCEAANPINAANCVACGAPLGDLQPQTCLKCGYVINEEKFCPNCGEKV